MGIRSETVLDVEEQQNNDVLAVLPPAESSHNLDSDRLSYPLQPAEDSSCNQSVPGQRNVEVLSLPQVKPRNNTT